MIVAIYDPAPQEGQARDIPAPALAETATIGAQAVVGREERLAILEAALDDAAERRSAMLAAAARSTRALTAAIAVADRSRAAVAARTLAGLGEGLTPAGDDFLIGALHALRLMHSAAEAKALAAAITAAAAPRTTTLSASWLRRAAAGEAEPEWRALLAEFSVGDRDALFAAARAVTARGHTSGHAALTGFVATLRAGTTPPRREEPA